MKGVVLSGGSGTRLRPLTFSMAKQLVPVANKPILFYGLEQIAAAGVREVVVVISPETGSEVRQAVGNGDRFGLSVEYVLQDRPRGLAHALAVAMPEVGDDDVLMYLGDNLLRDGVSDVVADFEAERPNCQILLTPVEDPRAFGVAEVDEDGRILRLIEKPHDPPSNLALVGVYLFDQSIRAVLDELAPSPRGEFEITDAIQRLIESGRRVRSSTVSGWWKDTGRKEDLLHANELILAALNDGIEGDLVDTVVRGQVRVEKGARVIDSVLTGPVTVASGATILRSHVGPYTAIGPSCRLSDANVDNSIVLEGTEIHGWKLHNSLLGRHCVLRGAPPGRSVELTLGERSEIIGE